MSERVILSGRYRGPVKVLQGQRGLLQTIDRKPLWSYVDKWNEQTEVLVQWDDLELHEEVVERTGFGWEKFPFIHFYDFHYLDEVW